MLSQKPRLLIIGARGFVGQHLARRASAEFDVVRADLTAADRAGVVIDLTSVTSIETAFRMASPHVVILLAAISDIDACEAQPQLAEEINARGVARVVEACARAGARLLFTSSAAVFDGTQHGYRESDEPTPLSVYGRTKASAEKLICQALPAAIILRMALVLGFAQDRGTNAMLNKFAEKLRAGQEIPLPNLEYRNPIDPGTLSDFILELLRNPGASGIIHVGASDPISRFDLGMRLAHRLGFSRDLIKVQNTPTPGRAARGLDHFLLTERIRTICQTPVPTCDEVVERATHGSSQGNL